MRLPNWKGSLHGVKVEPEWSGWFEECLLASVHPRLRCHESGQIVQFPDDLIETAR